MQDLRALVVDDSKVGRLTMQRKLEAMGIRVELAESGPEALDMLSRQRPDLIFMDHMMPDMDGFEVTRRIQASPALRDIPVIIVSGNDEAGFVEEARQAGALDVMTKPPATEALESLLASLPSRAGEPAEATEPSVEVVARLESAVAALRAELDERLARQAASLDALDRRLAELAARPAPDLPALSADLEQRLAGQQARSDGQAAEFARLRETLLARLDAQAGESAAKTASLRQDLVAVRSELAALHARLEESRPPELLMDAAAGGGPAPATRDDDAGARGELDRLRAGFRRLTGMTLLGGAVLLVIAILALMRG